MSDAQLEFEFKRSLRVFRLAGVCFALIGGGMLVFFLVAAFDDAQSIRINDVDTKAFGPKMGAAAFVAVFPAIGVFLALMPKKLEVLLYRARLRAAEKTRAFAAKK